MPEKVARSKWWNVEIKIKAASVRTFGFFLALVATCFSAGIWLLSHGRTIMIRPTTDYWIRLSEGYLGIGSRHSLYSLLIPLWALTSLGVLLTMVLGWHGRLRPTDTVGFPVEARPGEAGDR
jgi:hypothetical protein